MINILKFWDLCEEKITPIDTIHMSAWDIGGKYILKRNLNADELSRSIQLANLLSFYNIPIATYVKTTDEQWLTNDGMYCLTKKLTGKHVDFYTQPNMIIELGNELARLHTALANIETQIKCSDNDFIYDWQNYIKPGLINISDEVMNLIETRFFNMYVNLPRQLIHRDVHSQNVLFDNGKLSGWLDFDISCHNVRVFDLAYLLAGLLCKNTNTPAMVDIWKTLYKNLLTGYESVNLITDNEKEALPFMMIAIELLFVTFWNNYGDVEQRDNAITVVEWLYGKYA